MKQKLFFLFIAALVSLGLWAQTTAPGGVTNPEIWFKTVPQTGDLQGNYIWKDFSGDSVKVRLYNSNGPLSGQEFTAPVSNIHTYNFNPAISLSATTAVKQFLINKANLSRSTFISVWGPDAGFDQDKFLYALNGSAGGGYIFTKTKVIHSTESGKADFYYGQDGGKKLLYPTVSEGDEDTFREHGLKIATYSQTLQPNTSVWGENAQSVVSFVNISQSNYPFNTSTFGTVSMNPFSGYTPEFIIYNRILTPLERSKVETYLAIKYGLTLEKSYIGSGDQLLWDRADNEGYNTRITGYMRDDQSGMLQKISATSCEENPNFSDNHQDSPYNLPGSYRLLVMGREDASPMEDGKYVLWGDNNESLTATEKPGIIGMKLMNRSWLLRTNLDPVEKDDNTQGEDDGRIPIVIGGGIIVRPINILDPGEEDNNSIWNTEGLDVYTEGFKTKATKAATSADASGYLVSSTPLKEKDGYLSWINSSDRHGVIMVKFGTDNPQLTAGSHDYGYNIGSSSNGMGNTKVDVYKIEKGEIKTNVVATINTNHKIAVAKEGNTIYLRCDTTRVHNLDITIDPEDMEEDFYGSITVNKFNNQNDVVLSDIRRGGFEETGNKVELSYDTERATGFSNYKTDGKSYLVIDHTGTGNFSGKDVEYIPSDELDEMRSKIIFNNIFWNSSGNGKEMFTFAYRQSDMAIAVSSEDPTCINDTEIFGKIDINMIYANKGYTYDLINTETQDEQSGTFYTDTLEINDVPPGTYNLTVSEISGFNFYPNQPGDDYLNQAIGSTYFTSSDNTSLEWTVTAGTQATVGFSVTDDLQNSHDPYNNQGVTFGLNFDNGNLYQIGSAWTLLMPIASNVQEGDRIGIERNGSMISYKLNGQAITTVLVMNNLSDCYYPIAYVYSGKVYNVTWDGMPSNATWLTTDNMTFENYSGKSVSQTITIEDTGCSPVFAPSSPQTTNPAPDSESNLTLNNPTGTYTVLANLQMDSPEAVTFIAFDMTGKPVYRENLLTPRKIQEVRMNVHRSGVYIIKAISTSGEHTGKIIVK